MFLCSRRIRNEGCEASILQKANHWPRLDVGRDLIDGVCIILVLRPMFFPDSGAILFQEPDRFFIMAAKARAPSRFFFSQNSRKRARASGESPASSRLNVFSERPGNRISSVEVGGSSPGGLRRVPNKPEAELMILVSIVFSQSKATGGLPGPTRSKSARRSSGCNWGKAAVLAQRFMGKIPHNNAGRISVRPPGPHGRGANAA